MTDESERQGSGVGPLRVWAGRIWTALMFVVLFVAVLVITLLLSRK